jgi:hypothetical protein
MFALFLTSDYAIFSVALVVMLGIGAIEAIGLGIGQLDADAGLDAGLLDWLGLKSGVPILIWLTSLLGCFTIAGVVIQQVATALLGSPLHWPLAAVPALLLGGVANSAASAGLARILLEYESSVIDTDDLLMRRGTILEGAARRGHPARARVVDQHGQAHYVMVEPHQDGDSIAQGESALLVRRAGALFFIQPDSSSEFRPL